MAKKKALIIGSNSFSGAHMIRKLLLVKFEIIGVSRSNQDLMDINFYKTIKKSKFKFYKIDLNNNLQKIISIIKKNKPQYIINFASQSMVAESWKKPEDWYLTNSLSTIKLYNSLNSFNYKKKLIHISTPEIYGSTKSLIKENINYNPTTPYAASRVAAEHFLKILYKNFNFNYCSVRSSNVFGEYQKIYRIIPKTICAILNKKKIMLEGNGASKRNFIYIEDVCDAIFKIMLFGKSGESFHISGKKIISIKELVKKICHMMNYSFNKLVINTKERLGKDQYYSLSSSKIRNELKWKENVGFENGLDKTIKSIKKNLLYLNKLDEIYIHKK
jgi:dTDP-glucose 4,6-dehydratase